MEFSPDSTTVMSGIGLVGLSEPLFEHCRGVFTETVCAKTTGVVSALKGSARRVQSPLEFLQHPASSQELDQSEP